MRRKGKPAEKSGRDPVLGWTTLAVGLGVVGFLFWRNSWFSMDFWNYNLLNIAFVLWVPLTVTLLFLRRDVAEVGFCTGDLRSGVRLVSLLFLLFLPVIIYQARTPAAQDYYLRWLSSSGALTSLYWTKNGWSGGRVDYTGLLLHQVVMGFYMFGWEWFFRGYLTFGLKRVMPVVVAVVIQAALFTVMHLGKPIEETISAFPGAILLAVIALRYRSFLPCFLLHWAISCAFDVAVLFQHFRG